MTFAPHSWQIPDMDAKRPTAFDHAFVRRTKRFREATGKSMVEMAALLNVPYENYRQYEKRSCMPHRYVPAFCEICRVTLYDLYGMTQRQE